MRYTPGHDPATRRSMLSGIAAAVAALTAGSKSAAADRDVAIVVCLRHDATVFAFNDPRG